MTQVNSIQEGYRQGFSFTPLHGKIPYLKNWQNLPRAPLDQCLQWADKNNIGLRTGSASAPNEKYLIVIDLDQGGDVSKLNLPDTVEVSTGKGLHYYYYTDEPLGNSSGKLGHHIDTRGEGGQVVYPGSTHPERKNKYIWIPNHSITNMPIADLPDHIKTLLKSGPPGQYIPKNEPDHIPEDIRIEIEKLKTVPQGQRNTELNNAALRLGHTIGAGDLKEGRVKRALLNAAIEIGLSEAEAIATIKSGVEKGTKEPKPLLINIISLDTVQPEPIHWLWYQKFALGKLSLIVGDPGLGKSFITLDIAARISKGIFWPDLLGEANPSGEVILLSAEDDPADTIRPRLDAMQADPSKIKYIESVKQPGGGDRLFNLERDVLNLNRVVKTLTSCRLIVIDPISAYMGRIDGHSNTDVRGLLAPLAKMAAQHQIATIAVSHLNKSGGGNPLYRAMGSLAFTAAARAVWTVTKDRADPERRLFLPAKNNISIDNRGLAYRLIDSRVEWDSTPIEATAAEVFMEDEESKKSPKRFKAKEWLRNALKDGPKPVDELKKAADSEDFVWRTVERAKLDCGVQAEYEGFGNAGKIWRLPS